MATRLRVDEDDQAAVYAELILASVCDSYEKTTAPLTLSSTSRRISNMTERSRSGKTAWDKEKTRELFRRYKETGDPTPVSSSSCPI